jgi:enolase-phosphatase E1
MSGVIYRAQGVLVDIEGTTSSIRFVYDVLFPFARRELASYLMERIDEPELAGTLELLAKDCGEPSSEGFLGSRGVAAGDRTGRISAFQQAALNLMDADAKSTGLKDLQGKIWESGFKSGELKSHVYSDVPPALAQWTGSGKDVRIYSSGSIAAQKLFFGHTELGDLVHFFRGHYDTTTGGKKESASYSKIATEYGLPPAEILFLSDVSAELDAARDAGFATGLLIRPGNPPQPEGHGHPVLTDFSQIRFSVA